MIYLYFLYLFQLSQLYTWTQTQPTPAFGSRLAAQVSRWENSSLTYRTTRSASPATTLSWALKPSPPADITGRWRLAPRQRGASVWCWPPSTGRRRSACAQRTVSGLWCWGTSTMATASMKPALTLRRTYYIQPNPPRGWAFIWIITMVRWRFMMQLIWATFSHFMTQTSRSPFTRISIPGRL